MYSKIDINIIKVEQSGHEWLANRSCSDLNRLGLAELRIVGTLVAEIVSVGAGSHFFKLAYFEQGALLLLSLLQVVSVVVLVEFR